MVYMTKAEKQRFYGIHFCRTCDGEGYLAIGTAFERRCSRCRGTGKKYIHGVPQPNESSRITQELPKGREDSE